MEFFFVEKSRIQINEDTGRQISNLKAFTVLNVGNVHWCKKPPHPFYMLPLQETIKGFSIFRINDLLIIL